MSKPNNSISKIKLPGENTGRPIVPTMLSDGTTTNIATLPTLSQDEILGLEKNTVYSVMDASSVAGSTTSGAVKSVR